MRTKQGFSLLELLLVLAVLGILMTVASASMSGPLRTYRARQTSKMYEATLKSIGQEARSQSKQITIDKNAIAQGKLVWYSGTTELGRKTLPEGATASISNIQFSNQPISFSGRGLPNQQVSISITRFDKTKVLTLLPSGLVISQ